MIFRYFTLKFHNKFFHRHWRENDGGPVLPVDMFVEIFGMKQPVDVVEADLL